METVTVEFDATAAQELHTLLALVEVALAGQEGLTFEQLELAGVNRDTLGEAQFAIRHALSA